MEKAYLVTLIDFLIMYVTFMYQRGTLLIARNMAPGANIKTIANIQAKYTPTWLGAIGWANYAVLVYAVLLLWNLKWWYAVVYVIFRFVGIGLLPTFERKWAAYIVEKYKIK